MARIPAFSDGARLNQDIPLEDSKGIAFGKADDITMRWDGTDFDVLPAADDSVVKWGNGTLNLDQWWYGGIATSYVLWDASADILSLEGPVRLKGFNALSPRFELKWTAGEFGLVGINADGHTDLLDPRFEVLGQGATADDVTYNAEGGLTFTTDGSDGDGVVLLPHLDTSQSVWTAVTWGSDKEVHWECMITTGAAITNSIVWAGLKDGLTPVVGAEDDEIFFRYENGVGAGKWQVISSRAGTDTTLTSGVTVAVSTTYHLKIVIKSDRTAECYINGALATTAAALADTQDFKPHIGVEADGAGEAKTLTVLGQAISRNIG